MPKLKIDYVEFASDEIAATTGFFAKAFGWTYADYGPTYQAFTNAGIDGGIDGEKSSETRPPLVILRADDIEAAQASVEQAGGVIVEPIFSFPGGRRFHFREPGGNEMAVWSEN